MPRIYCQDWEESERGWGVRPDGFTLHLTLEDHAGYVKGFYEACNNQDEAPDDYTRASGSVRRVKVSAVTQEAVVRQKKSSTVNLDWQRYGMWGEGKIGPRA